MVRHQFFNDSMRVNLKQVICCVIEFASIPYGIEM